MRLVPTSLAVSAADTSERALLLTLRRGVRRSGLPGDAAVVVMELMSTAAADGSSGAAPAVEAEDVGDGGGGGELLGPIIGESTVVLLVDFRKGDEEAGSFFCA